MGKKIAIVNLCIPEILVLRKSSGGTGYVGEIERQRTKKVNRNTYNISTITRVTGKFLEVSRCSR